ncbi:MAG TPA: thioredoxin family protein [bacterium]|nr:thioredoxin family protein [bacterium]
MKRLWVLWIALVIGGGYFLAGCSKERETLQPPQPAIAWSSTLTEAKLEAQKTGDRILASFEAYWCPWSRLLRESLYVDPAVVDSLASFKCVSIDADRDTALCAEYDIQLYPTIVIMDAYGGEIERLVGYYSPDEFLSRLSSIRLRDALVADTFRREEQSANDPRFLMDFADLLRNVGTYDAALLRYEKAADLDKNNLLGIYEEATYAMAECDLLAGKYREAGDRFSFFVKSNGSSDRCGEATVLAALCYERARDRADAIAMLEAYLKSFKGEYSDFAAKRLADLRAGG